MTPLKRAELAILRVANERHVIMGSVAANHMAIEVLKAIREPGDALLAEVYAEGCWNCAPDEIGAIYSAVIDTALCDSDTHR